MTPPQAPAPPELRTNNLALCFQEVFTVILRTRFFVQRVENADTFRATLRKMISAAVKDASTLGYSDEASKMAIYAMIGFLDESVLNSKDPTFADWARRPLQEEMFGGHFAGEYFFRNLTELLNRPESTEVADVLELHALCLLLGYRGRFAFGDASEIHTILHRIREKIARIRGAYSLFRPIEAPSAPPAPKRDPWVGRLAITAIVLAAVTVLAFVGYLLILGQAIPTTAEILLPPAVPVAPISRSAVAGASSPALFRADQVSFLSGHDFSRAERLPKMTWALAPEASSPERTSL